MCPTSAPGPPAGRTPLQRGVNEAFRTKATTPGTFCHCGGAVALLKTPPSDLLSISEREHTAPLWPFKLKEA